jgi:hypothetical protein
MRVALLSIESPVITQRSALYFDLMLVSTRDIMVKFRGGVDRGTEAG